MGSILLAFLALFAAVVMDRRVQRRVTADRRSRMQALDQSLEELDVQLRAARSTLKPGSLWDYLRE